MNCLKPAQVCSDTGRHGNWHMRRDGPESVFSCFLLIRKVGIPSIV